MKAKNKVLAVNSWSDIKDRVYGKKGTKRRDDIERESESFKIGLLLKNARESKNLTQEELALIIDKKRTYISRVENDGSNITLKTLFDIVEKGLGGKVKISIDF
ncbi:MAG: helix-turn-helix transcriptional regulator [Cytophagaceae bacterium]|jgi:DNA-binding XRE family transcriptional regulator|nr:helix-turn-helix transcriptional regulator [Cytophagaceae bacterium]